MRQGFDPLKLFPSRVATQKIEVVRECPQGGATSYTEDGRIICVKVPVKNTAYNRTVRRHEALHCIYSKPDLKEDCNYLLVQALEDARMHLVCSRATGAVRRDELATALIDLKNDSIEKPLLPLIVLRSAAILKAAEDASKPMLNALEKKAANVHDTYMAACNQALDYIRRGDMASAKYELRPYFSDEESRPSTETFPSAAKTGDGIGKNETGFDAPVETKEQDPTLSKEDKELLVGGGGELRDFEKNALVETHLKIHNLAAYDNIPTFFGASEKRVPSGKRIKAKALATIVGPGLHCVFTKTIKRKGGSVLIDASSSMSFTTKDLLRVIAAAPLAIIAFYNAPNDDVHYGNLWIFSNKARRAMDLGMVKTVKTHSDDPERWGLGNVVDLQAMRWLLKQPRPRYYVTDGEFTGPCASMARAMFCNARSQKLFTQVWDSGKDKHSYVSRRRDHLARLQEIIEKRG